MTLPAPLLVELAVERRPEWIPATVMGVGLILLGGWFMSQHWRTWCEVCRDASVDTAEREYYRRQFRRRMQASGIILIIGLLVPIGDWVIPWRPRQDASLITLYWLFVLALTCWVLLLAMGDFASTRAHSSKSLFRLQQKQQELQAEADRLRAASRSGRYDKPDRS